MGLPFLLYEISVARVFNCRDGIITSKLIMILITFLSLSNFNSFNGYVLLCVARAVSDCRLEIGVESHNKLYRNPFIDPLEPHELKADIATPKEA